MGLAGVEDALVLGFLLVFALAGALIRTVTSLADAAGTAVAGLGVAETSAILQCYTGFLTGCTRSASLAAENTVCGCLDRAFSTPTAGRTGNRDQAVGQGGTDTGP